MKKVYAEVGFGNDSFFSTEFEEGDSEYRVPRFVRPATIEGYYLRIWLGTRVFILSTNDGFVINKKKKNKIKILFGISGRE